MKEIISKVLLIILFLNKNVASQEGTDCLGKAFHCVNSTHFLICVDFGHGISVTVDNFAIPCPSSTTCRHGNKFECELESRKNVTPMDVTTNNIAFAAASPTSLNTEHLWEAAFNNTDSINLQFENTNSSIVTVEKEALTDINNSSSAPPRDPIPALILSTESASIRSTPQTSTYGPINISYSVNDSAINESELSTPISTVMLNQFNTSEGVNTITKNTPENINTLSTIPNKIQIQQYTANSLYNSNDTEFQLISVVPPSTENYISSVSENLHVTNKDIYELSTSQGASTFNGIGISIKDPPSLQHITQESKTTHGVIETGNYNTLKPNVSPTAASKSTDQTFFNITPELSAHQLSTSSSRIAISATYPSTLQNNTQGVREHMLIETHNYSNSKPSILLTTESISTNLTFVNITYKLPADKVETGTNEIEVSTIYPSIAYRTEKFNITPEENETQNNSILQPNVPTTEVSISANLTSVNFTYKSSTSQVATNYSGIEISTTSPLSEQYITQQAKISPAVIERQNYSIRTSNISTVAVAKPMKETSSINITYETSHSEVPKSSSTIEISTTDFPPLQNVTQEWSIRHELNETEYYNYKQNYSIIPLTISTDLKDINMIDEMSANQTSSSSSRTGISSMNPSTLQLSIQEVRTIPTITQSQNFHTSKPSALMTATSISTISTSVDIPYELPVGQMETSSSGIEMSTTSPSTAQYITQETMISPAVIETQNNNSHNRNVSTTGAPMNEISVNITHELSAYEIPSNSSGINISRTNSPPLQYITQDSWTTYGVNETEYYNNSKANISTVASIVTELESINLTSNLSVNQVRTISTGNEISTNSPSTPQYITQEAKFSPTIIETQIYSELKPNISTITASISVNQILVNITPELQNQEIKNFSEIDKSATNAEDLDYITHEVRFTRPIIKNNNDSTSKSNAPMTAASISMIPSSVNITYESPASQVETISSGIEISTNNPFSAQYITHEARISPVIIEIQSSNSHKPIIPTTASTTTHSSTANEITTNSSSINIFTMVSPLLQHVTQESRTTNGVYETHNYLNSKSNDSTTPASIVTELKSTNITFESLVNQMETSFKGIEISTASPSTAQYITQEARISPAGFQTENDNSQKSHVPTISATISTNEISVNITNDKSSANEGPMNSSRTKISTTDRPTLEYVTQLSRTTDEVYETEYYNNVSESNKSPTAALTDLLSVNITHESSVSQVETHFSGIETSTTGPSTPQGITQEARIEPTETQNLKVISVNITHELLANELPTNFSENKISTINSPPIQNVTQESNTTYGVIEKLYYNNSKTNNSTTVRSILMDLTFDNLTSTFSANQVITSSSEIEILTNNSTTSLSTHEYTTEKARFSPTVIETQNYITIKPNNLTIAESISVNQISANITLESSPNQVTRNFSATDKSVNKPDGLQYIITQDVKITPPISKIQYDSSLKPNVSLTAETVSMIPTSVNTTYESSVSQVEKSSNGIKISITKPSTVHYNTEEANLSQLFETQNSNSHKPNASTEAATISTNVLYGNITHVLSMNSSLINISTTASSPQQHVTQESRFTYGVNDTQFYVNSNSNDSTTAASTLTELKSANITYESLLSQVETSNSGIEISAFNPSTAQYITQETKISPAVMETENDNSQKSNIPTISATISTNEISVNITNNKSSANEGPMNYSRTKISTTDRPTLQHVNQVSRTTHEVYETEYYNNVSESNNSPTAASTLANLISVNIIHDSTVSQMETRFNGIDISTTSPSTAQHITQEATIVPADAQNYNSHILNASSTAEIIYTNEISVNIKPELSKKEVAINSSVIKIFTIEPSTVQYVTKEISITPALSERQNLKPNVPNILPIKQKYTNIIPQSFENQGTNSSGFEKPVMASSPLPYFSQESRTTHGVTEPIRNTFTNSSKKNYPTTLSSARMNQTYVNIIPGWSGNEVTTIFGGNKQSTMDPSTLKHSIEEGTVIPTVVEKHNYVSTFKPNVLTTAESISINTTLVNITPELSVDRVAMSSSGTETSVTDSLPLEYIITPEVIEMKNNSKFKENVSMTIASKDVIQTPINATLVWLTNQETIIPSTTEIFTLVRSPLQYDSQKVSETAALLPTNQTSVNMTIEWLENQVARNVSGIEISMMGPPTLQLSKEEIIVIPTVTETQNYSVPKQNFSTILSATSIKKSINNTSESLENRVKMSTSEIEIYTTDSPASQNVTEESNITHGIKESEFYNNLQPNESMAAASTTASQIINALIPESPENQVLSTSSVSKISTTDHTTSPLKHITQEVSITSVVIETQTKLSSIATSTSTKQTLPSQVLANQAPSRSSKIEMSTKDPYPLPHILQGAMITPALIEPQNYNTLKSNFSTMTASLYFNRTSAYITSAMTAEHAKQIAPDYTNEPILYINEREDELRKRSNVLSSPTTTSISTTKLSSSIQSKSSINHLAGSIAYNVNTSNGNIFTSTQSVFSTGRTIKPAVSLPYKTTIPEIEPSQFRSITSTRNYTHNVLESTSEVAQVSTIANENEKNSHFHNINTNSEIKKQELLENLNFTCNGKNIGRYADLQNPKKFYICVGMTNPIIGICPQNAIYVTVQNKCYKNATICEQFHCLRGGRFPDPCSRDSYFICHPHSSGALVRYKLQCQKGYYVSSSVKCASVGETAQKLINNANEPKTPLKKINEAVVFGVCPGNEIYNASTNKCYKVNNPCTQFHCSHLGRFKDPCSSKSYYICQQNSSGALVRYKLQCQSGYEVNSVSIKCTPLVQMPIINYSKIEEILQSGKTINKSSEEKVDKIKIEKNVDNKDIDKFKAKTKTLNVATYLTTNKQIEKKITDNEYKDKVKLDKILKVKINKKDKYSSKESSEENYEKNIKKKQIKREIQVKSSQSVENDKFVCETEGTYPIPEDYRKYYECIYIKKRGKFRRRRKSCKNNEMFNADVKKCLFNKNKPLNNESRSNESRD